MRWNKEQKELESRLANCLKERICYSFDSVQIHKSRYAVTVFRITVDGETWLETNDKLWYDKLREYSNKYTKSKYDYWNLTPEKREYCAVKVTEQAGTVGISMAENIIQKYLNIYKIDKCLNNENYFFKVLAVLDHRTGRRKIKQLLENIDNEPEWFRKYIRLRAEAQNIYID